MRPRTAAALVAVLAVLGAAFAVGLADDRRGEGGLAEQWVSDTNTDVSANHHAPAAGRAAGTGLVFAPVSGSRGSDRCALYALYAANGSVAWRHPIPPANCTVHAVADPTLADADADGTAEVLAATTEREVTARHPLTGAVELRHRLPAYGYTRPVVANLTGDGDPEIAVVDVRGTAVVLRGDGEPVWTRDLDGHVWGQPVVADVDGRPGREVVVALGGTGGLRALRANGSDRWRDPPTFAGSITWLAAGQTDGDPARELVVGTAGGEVAVVDGTAGRVRWERDLGRLAAVRAVGDGDRDGRTEVYATAADGVLRALDARDGSVEWTTRLARADDVQMMPPPTLGDATGDGRLDLVAPANDGTVSLVDPATGAIRATYRRSDRIFTHATLADADVDGVPEVYVGYADGRVVALEATQ